MRASHRVRWSLVSLVGLLAAVGHGCTWGSTNGVPFWGSKKEREEAAANRIKYGPLADDRIKIVEAKGKMAANGSPQDKENVAAEFKAAIPNEQDPLVRIAIMRALAGIQNETAARVLCDGMKDPDPNVRVVVCEAWGKRALAAAKPGGPAASANESDVAVRLLAQALSGETIDDVRLAAARALANIKNDPRAVGALGIALKDRNPALQFRAVASLKEISHQDFGNDVAKWQQYVDSVAPPMPQQPKAVADRPQALK